jgi:hypothetical protein
MLRIWPGGGGLCNHGFGMICGHCITRSGSVGWWRQHAHPGSCDAALTLSWRRRLNEWLTGTLMLVRGKVKRCTRMFQMRSVRISILPWSLCSFIKYRNSFISSSVSCAKI